MRSSSIPLTLVLIAGTLNGLPALADSTAIGTIQVSPDLRSALQSAAEPPTAINILQQLRDKGEIEKRLTSPPVPARPDPRVYRQFEEPRRRGIGFKVGL
ncbi:hypothetical protein [Thermosynechococcus sp.]|uniref:hypothetical protein n=1 Tax=Thermosynechococcus sp. TaxID=2814275 RepID=UPI00391D5A1F